MPKQKRLKGNRTEKSWREFKECNRRKARRGSFFGFEFEEQISEILEKFVEEGFIDSFEATKRYSELDCNGIDFIVKMEGVDLPFGVTTSLKRWQMAKQRYPEVVQFCFPQKCCNPETLKKNIKKIFAQRKAS